MKVDSFCNFARKLIFLPCLLIPILATAQTTPEGSVTIVNPSSISPSSLKKGEKIKEEVLSDALFDDPLFTGKVGFSLSSDDTYEGRTANNPINSYASAYVLGNLYATKDLYVSANLRYASSKGDATTGNYFLDEGSAFVAELVLRYDADNWSALVGHTNINHSLSRNNAAGLWGNQFAKKEVGVDGMMVMGGSYAFDMGRYGNHSLSARAFMVDTTVLSDTFGSNRDPTPLSIGGSGNTGKFNNYSVALDGIKIKDLPKFRYQLGGLWMKTNSLEYTLKGTKGNVDTKYLGNEQRYVVSAMWDKLDLISNIKVTPLLEYNRILNADGIDGYAKTYYIGSLLFGYKQWNFGMSGGVWDANWQTQTSALKQFLPSNSFTNDRYNQFQAALGYVFENGIKATIGYKKENKYSNLNTQTIGMNLKYDLPIAF